MDQQRTKRMVKIISIICAVAFVGVLPVVLGLILFGDHDTTGQGQIVKEAEAKVNADPANVQALVDLARQYRAANRSADAETTLQRAIDAPPKTVADLEAVVYALADTPQKQFVVLKRFTGSHPANAAGWMLYGQIAEQQTQALQARLAYGRALATAGADKSIRADARSALERISTMQTATTLTPTLAGDATGTTAAP